MSKSSVWLIGFNGTGVLSLLYLAIRMNRGSPVNRRDHLPLRVASNTATSIAQAAIAVGQAKSFSPIRPDISWSVDHGDVFYHARRDSWSALLLLVIRF
jgi:hypothetical protein